jgi:hypothetical protein
MKSRINKPKVFLSHSSADKPFIEKLAGDLRHCQIDYWLDSEEIRDGRSWLKMIFEDGIPTCDAVVVYFTEDSLKSKMVEKELDATVVEQLAKGGITLLPYVASKDIRASLRSDLRALHCREWNEGNYKDLLPSVVAEIWRSYLERTVEGAILQEKNRRLELELEIRQINEKYASSVFSTTEGREFEHLFKRLDRKIEMQFSLFEKEEPDKASAKIGEEICRFSLLWAILEYIRHGRMYFEVRLFEFEIGKALVDFPAILADQEVRRVHGQGVKESLTLELQTYGLIRHTTRVLGDRPAHSFEFAEKMYRFKYWLDYNNYSLDQPSFEFEPRLIEKAEVKNTKVKQTNDRPTEDAIKADRRISLARRRNQWLTTEEGVSAVKEEVNRLFDELDRRVKNSNDVLQNIKLGFTKEEGAQCLLFDDKSFFLVNFECPLNTLYESVLKVRAYNGTYDHISKILPADEKAMAYKAEFDVHPDDQLKISWRRRTGSQDYSTSELADLCWSTFLGVVQRREEEPR